MTPEALLLVVPEATQLEILCEQQACVVYLGLGLEWMLRNHIQLVVGIDAIGGAPQARSTKHQVLYDLTMDSCDPDDVDVGTYHSWFKAIGDHLRALKLNSACGDSSLALGLDVIVRHCPRLENLDLSVCRIATADVEALLNLLRGDFGRRLVSLNLNGIELYSDTFLLKLAASLLRSKPTSSIRELRVAGIVISLPFSALVYFAICLKANRILEIVELLKWRWRPEELLEELQIDLVRQVRTYLQGEALHRILPLSNKLAFLSCIFPPQRRRRRSSLRSREQVVAHNLLSVEFVTLIFQYTAPCDAYRWIV